VLAQLPPRAPRTVYVVNSGNELIAALDPRALAAQRRRGGIGDDAPVATFATPVRAALTPDMSLTSALDLFLRERADRLPVISSAWRAELVGEVLRRDLLLALHDRLAGRP
jgi:hypothetical protein